MVLFFNLNMQVSTYTRKTLYMVFNRLIIGNEKISQKSRGKESMNKNALIENSFLKIFYKITKTVSTD